ncbi:MAG: TonB family protein [Roseovarius sp.]
MIGASPLAKGFALVSAVALHGVALWALTGQPSVEIGGAAGGAEASLGSSFADMAAGTLTPSTPQERQAVTPPEAVTAPDPAEIAEPAVPETITETTTETITAAEASDAPEPVPQAPEAQRADAPSLASPEAEVPEDRAEPVIAAAIPQAAEADFPEPVQPRPVAPATSVAPSKPQEVIEAEEERATAVTASLRPRSRPAPAADPAPAPAPQPVARAEPAPQPAAKPQAQGNAAQSARTGTAAGSEAVREQAKAGTGQATQSGNAAASNYPGVVMQKISRVRRPQVGARGTAVVAFTIAPGGGLSGLSLAQSSGSGALDQAALGVIRRAAPFPAPPPGAQRSFSIRIKGG